LSHESFVKAFKEWPALALPAPLKVLKLHKPAVSSEVALSNDGRMRALSDLFPQFYGAVKKRSAPRVRICDPKPNYADSNGLASRRLEAMEHFGKAGELLPRLALAQSAGNFGRVDP
jgi:hypothetical protein